MHHQGVRLGRSLGASLGAKLGASLGAKLGAKPLRHTLPRPLRAISPDLVGDVDRAGDTELCIRLPHSDSRVHVYERV